MLSDTAILKSHVTVVELVLKLISQKLLLAIRRDKVHNNSFLHISVYVLSSHDFNYDVAFILQVIFLLNMCRLFVLHETETDRGCR